MENKSVTKFVITFENKRNDRIKGTQHGLGSEIMVQVYRNTIGKELLECEITIFKNGDVEWAIKRDTISGDITGEVIIIG